jgi:hypothetical protein
MKARAKGEGVSRRAATPSPATSNPTPPTFQAHRNQSRLTRRRHRDADALLHRACDRPRYGWAEVGLTPACQHASPLTPTSFRHALLTVPGSGRRSMGLAAHGG